MMKELLFVLDTGRRASPFDLTMAYDAGFEDLSSLFDAAETALALSEDRETVNLMLDVLRDAGSDVIAEDHGRRSSDREELDDEDDEPWEDDEDDALSDDVAAFRLSVR